MLFKFIFLFSSILFQCNFLQFEKLYILEAYLFLFPNIFFYRIKCTILEKEIIFKIYAIYKYIQD